MADVLPSDELVDEPSDHGALQPGVRLGRYEMLVPIARGGMARVWAARLHGQRGFQKLVAIKVILPHLAEEPEFERMFLDEARIASGVHHPNVCEIYELGEEKKTLYLVMEWVSGDSFARVLRVNGKTEAIDPRVVARVIADACAGVHAAHELTDDDGRALGVVHRDLSPHNILVTADGTAKVCDFGVAKALGQLHEATSAGQLKGKIAYMAPEQITGASVDRRSDVFSLGCVLYEATTGVRPFRGDGDHQVMHAVLKGELAPPSSLLRGYPQDLERIVLRALSPQPILRYPTAERMRFALEEYVARGQLVTQSNVAQVLKARIGDQIERRKERIRQASTAGDQGGWSDQGGNMTPSNQGQGGHRSGVKASASAGSGANHPAVRPLYSTMQMNRSHLRSGAPPPAAPPSLAPQTPQLVPAPPPYGMPSSSTTIPHAPPYALADQHAAHAQGAQGHTPVSHPGASHPGPPPAPQRYSGHAPAGHPQDAASSAPPPAKAFGQTSLMPQQAGMSPTHTIPPTSSGSGPFSQPSHDPHSTGPQGSPPVSAGAATGDSPVSSPQGTAGHYAVAVGVGVLLAALIGVGGFFVWRARHAAPALENGVTTTARDDRASGQVPPLVSPSASSLSGVAPVSADIAFRLTPADATLSVEGLELAGGVRTVPRPAMGKSVNVVARAKGYDDATMLVDFFTTSPMELTLKPVGANAQAGPPPTATGEEGKDPPKEPAKRPRQQPKEPAVPTNPY